MQVQVEAERPLRLEDGTAVRAASALAPLGDGWVLAQGDSSTAVLLRGDRAVPLELGRDDLDLQAACALPLADGPAALLLGSGQGRAGRRAVLLRGDGPQVALADLGPLHDAVARALGVPDPRLEGVARNGGVLRWFSRRTGGLPSGSVDVGLAALVEAVLGQADPADVPLRSPRRYDVDATDAVALPGGRVLLAVAGPQPGLALVDDERVLDRADLAAQVDGLGVRELTDDGARLLAVGPAGDGSAARELRVTW